MSKEELVECRAWTRGDLILKEYHDKEWCKINHDDNFIFQMLCLESASIGLSWKIIMHRREAYRKSFHDFNIDLCAGMTDDELTRLTENPDLIRNKKKIFSVRSNALAVKKIQKEFGSFDSYLWNFADGKQIIGSWKSLDEIPAESDLSREVCKDMKKRGIIFIGPVIVYSFLQSIGIINDHLESCECK